MKICTKCKVEKALTSFGVQKRGKFGVRSICKECLSIYNKSWNNKNVIKCRNYTKKSYQKNKDKIKKRSLIWRNNNKDYLKQKDREYQKLNKSKVNLKGKSYREAKKNNNFIKTELQKFVAQEMYDLAQIRKAETGIDWHVDHIEPLSKGGRHAIKNLQVVPAIWNMSKGNRNNNIFKIGEI